MNKVKKILVLAFFILALMPIVNAQNKNLDWLHGNWKGIGFQPSGYESSVWEIEFSYNNKTGEAVINYPTLECSGTWKLVKVESNAAIFHEELTSGLDVCENGGKVVVTRVDDNYVSVSYFYPELYNGVISFSTLERQ